MVRENRTAWKAKYFERLGECLNEYDRCFIVGVDNVRSSQMQKIRISLRGQAEIVMGKNTMMRKVIAGLVESKSTLEKLLPHIVENIGFVFTKGDLNDVRQAIDGNRVQAPAKSGAIAQCDVVIPKQNTGLGPEKTSFFQALSIQTKITKGTIEIINDVPLIKTGDKVGQSEAALLTMLKIFPFHYGLVIRQVFDEGSVYSPDVLDITSADLLQRIMTGIANVAAVSLAAKMPTAASVPHSLINGYKKVLAVALGIPDYSFPAVDKVREYLKDPSKFAAAAAPTEAAGAAKSAAPAKKEEVKEEEPEESDEDMGFDLFN